MSACLGPIVRARRAAAGSTVRQLLEGCSSGRMGVAELPKTMESLARRASALRDSLQRSQGNTESMVAILGSFDHRLSALEAAMRPTQVRTHAIRMAHEKIDKMIKAAGAILAQFDIARRAEATILRGPHEDLERYLEAVGLLKGFERACHCNPMFFLFLRFWNPANQRDPKSREGFLNQVNNFLSKSALKIEEEFKQLMSVDSLTISRGAVPVFPGPLPTPQRASKGDPEAGDGNSTHYEHTSKSLETEMLVVQHWN